MRNVKKLLVALLLVLTSLSLTSCSSLNKVTTNFEEQGYISYQYNQSGGSIIWELHDLLLAEEIIRLEAEAALTATTTTTGVTTTSVTTVNIGGDDTTTTTEEEEEQVYFGFDSYVFSNGVLKVVVMVFESEDFLLDRLAESVVLQAYFADQEQADFINGNCLLVVAEEDMDNYDLFVDIFQGRLDPIEITEEVTTTELTTETTTVTE